MFNKSKIHLVPPVLQDRAEVMLDKLSSDTVKDNIAEQFEVVRDFCLDTLQQFDRAKIGRPIKKGGPRRDTGIVVKKSA